LTNGLSSAGLRALERRIMSTLTDGKLSLRSMKASAALWPEPTMAMRIGLPWLHGRVARLLR
jgi:hypothetical protein